MIEAQKIKNQKSNMKMAESPQRGDDFLNFTFCFLHFDLSSISSQ